MTYQSVESDAIATPWFDEWDEPAATEVDAHVADLGGHRLRAAVALLEHEAGIALAERLPRIK